MRRFLPAAAAALLTLSAVPATAAPAAPPPKPAGVHERVFEYRLLVDGGQDWSNGPQKTTATTRQEYVIRTRLRSDGVLYSDNLLDPDQAARLDIKEQYYARMGLNALKRANGGRLPDSADDAQSVIDRRQKAGVTCFGSFECNQRAIEQLAAINALKANSREDLEAFLEAPGIGDVPRYRFYFGYGGCPIDIRVRYDVKITGIRAFDRDKQKLEPYALHRVADSTGSDEDRRTLCDKYIVVVDTLKGGVFVENLFIPSPMGSSTLTRNALATTDRDIPLPPPFEVLNWTSEQLRGTPADRFDQTLSLPMDFPLDGDHTIQGRFKGQAKVSFRWSFAEPGTAPAASGAPPAPAPAPVPARKPR
jgi:hypothetical protein